MNRRFMGWWSVIGRLMLSADGMAPADTNAAERLEIERRMLDLLTQGVRQVLLTSIVIGPALTTWLTLPHIGVVRAVTPLLILLAFGVERAFFLRRIARERALADETPRYWANQLGYRLLLGSFVVLTWFHFAIESGNRILISEMVALLTILAAGGAALFSSWPPVMWAISSSLLLGMAAQLVLTGDPQRLVEAVFCTVLWLVLVSASLRSARTLHRETLAVLRNQQLVRELRDKHAQAEAANAAKSRFFAAVNHDLRQPLQAMSLYLSTLEPGGRLKQDETTLRHIRQSMKTLDQMLESMLDFSRTDAAQLEANLRAFALQPLFDQLASVHKAMAQQQGLQLRVRATGMWVHTDPVLLERALSNLLTNALRYTECGGVLLGARRRGDRVRLCVIDTGAGIPDDAQESIYEEFVQLQNPARSLELGHGLGLPTVRRIANVLGASVHLRSQLGRGSIFMLEVPLARHDAPTDSPPDIPELETQLQGQVLIVEDNAAARDALMLLLTDWGLEVQAVTDGEAACREMARQPFDAVLSDWRLPGTMDGVAILREARRQLPRLKIGLLITGEDRAQLQHLKLEFPVLRKPLRPLRLRSLLTRHLNKP